MRTALHTNRVAPAIIAGLLALPAAASAGGWATVQLSSTPDNMRPGATWKVDIEVLQHGRTPLDDVHPTVTISSGGVSRTFTTRPTGKPGTHRAEVAFPRAGTWRYVIDDGFTARHSYPPVQIGPGTVPAAPSAAGGENGGPAWERIGIALLAGLAAAALALVPRRRRRAAAAGG